MADGMETEAKLGLFSEG